MLSNAIRSSISYSMRRHVYACKKKCAEYYYQMDLICSMCHTNAFIFTIKLICQTLLKAFLHVVLPTNWSACMVSACFSFVYCIHVKRSTWPTFNELCLKFWIENSPSLLVYLLSFSFNFIYVCKATERVGWKKYGHRWNHIHVKLKWI